MNEDLAKIPVPVRSERNLRFAVVLRTFQWDNFIARQLGRYEAVSEGADLFISADNTRGSMAAVPYERVFCTTDASLIALGLANRFDKGSLCWWNADYPNYAFHKAYPDYDYYAFVEYDSLVRQPLAPILHDIARRDLDFVAAPITSSLESWYWWPYARQTYDAAELRASLNCIAVYSNRALATLFERRLVMARDPRIKRWPISEAFVLTEIERAGFGFAPLHAFGDDSAYRDLPPILEDDLNELGNSVFVHPVLDMERYVKSILEKGGHWRDYFVASSPLRTMLNRAPKESYAPQLRRAGWQRFKRDQRQWVENRILRMRLAWWK